MKNSNLLVQISFIILFIVICITIISAIENQDKLQQYKSELLKQRILISNISNKILDIEKENEQIIQIISNYHIRIARMKKSQEQKFIISIIGAVLLIIGIFFELIGATLLASEYLANPIKEIFNPKNKITLKNLGVENTNLQNKIYFIATLGTVFLILGFLLQFIGTLFIITQEVHVIIIISCALLLIWLWLLYYISGLSTEQTRLQKIRIFSNNFYRWYISPLVRCFQGKKKGQCNVCLKFMSYDNGEVWWFQEPNIANYPLQHLPYNFNFGHAKCLENSAIYSIIKGKKLSPDKLKLEKSNVSDFQNLKIKEIREMIETYKKKYPEMIIYSNKITEEINNIEKSLKI